MLLRITNILNEDNLHFKMRRSSLVAFRIIANVVMKCLPCVLYFCEIKLLSGLQWEPKKYVAASLCLESIVGVDAG
jgi:hypothetical protein